MCFTSNSPDFVDRADVKFLLDNAAQFDKQSYLTLICSSSHLLRSHREKQEKVRNCSKTASGNK